MDDDAAARTAIQELLSSVGLRAETFGSASEFMQRNRIDAPSCLVLDVRLPGMSGLEFQRELAARKISIPIIFITAHGDIPMCAEAMKFGAMDFLTKPFRGQVLLDAIQKAIERDRGVRLQETNIVELRGRLETLTPREFEVMARVTAGLLNKQIASELGTSERTVKVQRSNVIRKMGAQSLADLVRMVEKLASTGAFVKH